VLEQISGQVRPVREDMRAMGAWVFSGELHAPSTATMLDPRNDEMPMIDRPCVEGKEHIGGLSIIEAESLDEARAFGPKVARATTLPVEVASVPERARGLTEARRRSRVRRSSMSFPGRAVAVLARVFGDIDIAIASREARIMQRAAVACVRESALSGCWSSG
jgi:hypothetical protein